jgi:hypothetical protein
MAEKLGATRRKTRFLTANPRRKKFIAHEGDYNGALRFNSFFDRTIRVATHRKDRAAQATPAVEFLRMFNFEQTCGPRPVRRP